MHTPPPTVPGIPWANSSPVRPSLQARSAVRASVAPASARMICSAVCSTRFRWAEVSITSRFNPSSGASRLLPLPITNGSAPLSSAKFSSSTSCSRLVGYAIRFAGPPMRKVVWRLMGSSQTTSRSGRYRLTASSNCIVQSIRMPPQFTFRRDAAPISPASPPSSAVTIRGTLPT